MKKLSKKEFIKIAGVDEIVDLDIPTKIAVPTKIVEVKARSQEGHLKAEEPETLPPRLKALKDYVVGREDPEPREQKGPNSITPNPISYAYPENKYSRKVYYSILIFGSLLLIMFFWFNLSVANGKFGTEVKTDNQINVQPANVTVPVSVSNNYSFNNPVYLNNSIQFSPTIKVNSTA